MKNFPIGDTDHKNDGPTLRALATIEEALDDLSHVRELLANIHGRISMADGDLRERRRELFRQRLAERNEGFCSWHRGPAPLDALTYRYVEYEYGEHGLLAEDVFHICRTCYAAGLSDARGKAKRITAVELRGEGLYLHLPDGTFLCSVGEVFARNVTIPDDATSKYDIPSKIDCTSTDARGVMWEINGEVFLIEEEDEEDVLEDVGA